MSDSALPPLVLIEWEDSAQPVPDWQYLADIGECEIVRCQSVGFLIHDGEHVKALAPNVGDLGDKHAQASGLMRIPARCVTRIVPLRAGD